MKVISYKAIKERVTCALKARNNETINKPVMSATYRVTGFANKWQLFAKSFFYGLAGPEGMQGRPWPHKSFLVLAFTAITALTYGQAEVQNPTFPFWKVMGNSGTNSSTNFVGTTDNISLRFRTNNTEKAVIDSIGNVGIGTSTPGERLHVYKTSGDAIIRVETPSSSYESRIEFWKWSGFNAAVGFYPGTSDLRLRTGQASDVIMEPNSTEVMRVRSNGNVGIGTSTPSEKLEVAGRIQATNPGTTPSGSNIILGSPANDIGITMNRGNGSGGSAQRWDIKITSDLSLRFRTSNSADRVTFTNTGRVGIGTTAPDTTLHVVGSIKMVDGNQATGYIMVSDANGVGKWTDGSTISSLGNDWHITGNSGTTAGTNFIGTTDAVDWVIKTNNTERARVKSTGNVGIATTTPGATLDVNGSGIIGTSNTNTGTNAVATGISNNTAGNYSFTAGQSNTITSDGTRGAVFNQSNSVTGNNSIAGGFQSNAGGNISFALGYADTATGQGSAAFGFSNIASANYTFAAGSNNNATAAQATAFGNDNTVSGSNSFASGSNNTVSSSSAFVTGNANTLSGNNSLVAGNGNTVTGTHALVGGNGNTVTATHSFVSGSGHTVAGNYSVVLNNSNSNTSAATTSITGGYQSQTQSNIGLAIGWADTTTGTAAAAFGRQNRSTANYAFSAGYNNTASGSQSAAFGDSNGAAGQSSFAMGAGNYVSGRSSLVTGELDTITSIASFAMGNRNTVTANGASAFGRYSTAAGYCSIVGGNNSYTRGDYSFAVGNVDTAYANYSFAAGNSNYAGGTASAAFGNNNTVTNSNSFATGDANTVSGSNSFAGGSSNIVSNYGSIALGLSDTASGYTSVAFNRGNYASGNHAVALGTYNSAPSFSELSVGMYSTTYTALNTTAYNAADRLFNVGNGSSSTARADAFTILKNGNVGVGTSTPATDLHVVGSIRMVDGTQAAGYILTSDANGTGSWVSPSSLGVGNAWNLTGNSGTTAGTNFIGTTDNVAFVLKTNNTERMRVSSTGNVGIGTTNPTTPLYVGFTTGTGPAVTIESGNSQYPTALSILASTHASSRRSGMRLDDWYLVQDITGNGIKNFSIWQSSTNQHRLSITTTGNIGLGTTAAADKLHVVGSIRMVDGNEANGYIMVSDVNGTGAWASPTSLGIGNGWNTTGNSGTTDGVNFIGTTDNVPFTIRVNNQQSGRIDPLLSNTFLGYWAGRDNSTGTQNTATGINALLSNSTGARNTAHGTGALESNTGSDNTAVGTYALNANTTGTYNSAFGKDADVASGALTNATAIGAYAQVDASNSLVLGSVDGVNGASATVNVGVGINSPSSTMHINGGFATTVKTAQAAGTNNPDNTAAVWVYSSGTGTITLPAAGTCSGRRYVILNQTGGARTTSTYIDITTASVTSVANNTSIEVISDGTNWRQIK